MGNVEIIRNKTEGLEKISNSVPHQIRSVIEFVINKKMDDEKLEKQINKLIERGAVSIQEIEDGINHSLSVQNRQVVEFKTIQEYWDAKKIRNLGDCWPVKNDEGLSGKVSAYEYEI